MKKIYLLMLSGIFCSSVAIAQKCVTQAGAGLKNGDTWANAYDNTQLQQAINEAEGASVKEVWVAVGTYRPTENLTGSADVDKSFILRNGVKIYGGFIGDGQDDLNTRDLIDNETILSGDFGGGVNAHHVVVNITNITGAVLDGFTITGGKANGTGDAVTGVARNIGGGLFLNSNVGVDLRKLIIKDNIANHLGGGIYLNYSGAAVYNFSDIKFINNICDGDNGGDGNAGALYVRKVGTVTGTAYITNCNFIGNQAFDGGGAVYNAFSATSTFNKCKFVGNKVMDQTTGAGAFQAYTGIVRLYNSVFYANETNSSTIFNVGSSTTKGTLIAVNNTFYKNKTRTGNFIGFFNNATRAELNFYNNIFRDNRAYTNVSDFASDDPSKFALTDIIRTATAAPQDYKNNLFETAISAFGGRLVADNVNFSDPLNVGKPLFGANITNPDAADFLNIVEGLATQAGTSTLATTAGLLPGTDLANNTRETHGVIDLGAYEYQGTLPVQFDYFKAAKAGNTANLNWRTFAETDNSHFIIERGSSSANFTELTRKVGAGTTTSASLYSFVDQNPLNGTNYYRLIQYDNNGDSKVLGEQALNFSLNASQNLVYPNPAAQKVFVKLVDAIKGSVSVDLVSLTGQTVLAKTYNISGNEEITIDLANVPRGSYILWLNKGANNGDKKKLLVVK